jgi:hypothetical protein
MCALSPTVSDTRPDRISITLPKGAQYASVARIVVGGLAARLNVSYESLDDLQLAVETVLAEEQLIAGDQATLDLDVGDGSVVIELGPIDVRATRVALGAGDLSLQTVLGVVVDETVVDEGRSTLRLRKALTTLQRD